MKRHVFNTTLYAMLAAVLFALPLTATPIATYEFNGDGSDASGNGHTAGTINATLTNGRAGMASTAYAFDKAMAHYIELSSSFGFIGGTNTFTIGMWVKVFDTFDNPILYAEHDGGSTRTFVVQILDMTNLAIVVQSGPPVTNMAPISLPLSNWIHLALVKDTLSNVTVYLDGEQRGVIPNVPTAMPGGGSWLGGSAESGITNYTSMVVDRIAFDSAALGATDISNEAAHAKLALMQGGGPVPPSVNFGNVSTTSSNIETFGITNAGIMTNLTLSSIPRVLITGADAANFLAVQPLSGTIAPGTGDEFQIIFAPLSAGTKTATVIISNNDFNRPVAQFTVTGNGTNAGGGPVTVSFDPAPYSSNASTNGPFTVLFDRAVFPDMGDVTITNLTAMTYHILPVGDAAVNITGSNVTITPPTPLMAGDTYAILIDSGALHDVNTNYFAGITNTSMWQFGVGAGGAGPMPEVGATWHASASAPFSGRQFHSTVVYDNKLWLVGGSYGAASNALNDVWMTTDMTNWSQVTPNATSIGRYGAGLVAFNGMMWLIGGHGADDVTHNDVWMSYDGSNWMQVLSNAPFGPREGFACEVYSNNIWMIGGFNGMTLTNDIWRSSDGTNWIYVTNNRFTPRAAMGTVVHDGKIYVIGGKVGPANFTNNVLSTADGYSWTQETSFAAFSPRGHMDVVSVEGKMLLVGGGNADAWSSTFGMTWSNINPSAPFTGRSGHALVPMNGRVWLIAGWAGGAADNLTNDIWYTDPIGGAVSDTMPPQLVGRMPIHNASAVPTAGTISLTFDEPVYLGLQPMKVWRLSDNALIFTIGTNSVITGEGTTTINVTPPTSLDAGVTYYITIGSNTFRDGAFNYFPGIFNATGWQFTTSSTAGGPVLVGMVPGPWATDVPTNALLRLTFNKPVFPGMTSDPFIIKRSNDNSTFMVIDSNAVFNGFGTSNITITPPGPLEPYTTYYIVGGSNTVRDAQTNYFPGLFMPDAWTFTTGSGTNTNAGGGAMTPQTQLTSLHFKANTWTFFALPYSNVTHRTEVFPTNAIVDPRFYVFTWAPIDNFPVETKEIHTGQGYWVYTPVNYTFTVNSNRLLPVNAPRQIGAPVVGWYAAGNPYPFPIDVRDLALVRAGVTNEFTNAVAANWVEGATFVWTNGGYMDTAMIPPGAGLWLRTKISDVTVVAFPKMAIPDSNTGAPQNALPLTLAPAFTSKGRNASTGEFLLSFSLEANGKTTEAAYIGALANAKDGYCSYDASTPPAIAKRAALSVGDGTKSLSYDMRKADGGTKKYLIDLSGLPIAGSARLTWSIVNDDIGYEYILKDVDTGEVTVLRRGDGITVNKSGSKKYILYAAPADDAVSLLGGETIEGVKAYPNPAHEQATFQLDVRQPYVSSVVVKVFDVAGRLVYQSTMAETATQVYTHTWDLKNELGMRVGKGVYFYKISIAEDTGETTEVSGKFAVIGR